MAKSISIFDMIIRYEELIDGKWVRRHIVEFRYMRCLILVTILEKEPKYRNVKMEAV